MGIHVAFFKLCRLVFALCLGVKCMSVIGKLLPLRLLLHRCADALQHVFFRRIKIQRLRVLGKYMIASMYKNLLRGHLIDILLIVHTVCEQLAHTILNHDHMTKSKNRTCHEFNRFLICLIIILRNKYNRHLAARTVDHLRIQLLTLLVRLAIYDADALCKCILLRQSILTHDHGSIFIDRLHKSRSIDRCFLLIVLRLAAGHFHPKRHRIRFLFHEHICHERTPLHIASVIVIIRLKQAECPVVPVLPV